VTSRRTDSDKQLADTSANEELISVRTLKITKSLLENVPRPNLDFHLNVSK
jgi:hypothetical protein